MIQASDLYDLRFQAVAADAIKAALTGAAK